MNPNSQKDQFVFNFPKDFVPENLEKKWMIHLKNLHKPFTYVLDYINSNIKSITLTGITIPVVEQKKMYGKGRNFRSSKSPYDLSTREFNIILKNTDFNIYYFILEDIILNHYGLNGVPFFPEFNITVLDYNRREHLLIRLKEVLITNMSEVVFAYNENETNEQTITLSCIYNYKDIEYLLRYDESNTGGDVYDEYSNVLIRNDNSIPKNIPTEEGQIIGE